MPRLDTHNQCIFLAVFFLVVQRLAVTMDAVKKITVITACTAPQHQIPGKRGDIILVYIWRKSYNRYIPVVYLVYDLHECHISGICHSYT